VSLKLVKHLSLATVARNDISETVRGDILLFAASRRAGSNLSKNDFFVFFYLLFMPVQPTATVATDGFSKMVCGRIFVFVAPCWAGLN